jgi:hypothetical protein
MKEIIIKGKFKAIFEPFKWDNELSSYKIFMYEKVGIQIGAYNPLSKGFWFDRDAVCVDEFGEFTKFIDSENLSFNKEK